MSYSHKLLAEALASFDPKLTALSPDTGPVPVSTELDFAIEAMIGLMCAGKALYAPTVLQTAGEYQAHQITLREQPVSEKPGKKLLEVTIYLDGDSPAKPMDAAVIAHGMIACAAQAAGVITRHKQEEEAAKKAEEAAAVAGASQLDGTPSAAPAADQSSSS